MQEFTEGHEHVKHLDDAAMVEFLATKGRKLGKIFLAWARRNSISVHDAKDSIQDYLLIVLRRLRDGTATPVDLSIPRVFCCGKRIAIRKDRDRKRSRPLDLAHDCESQDKPDEVWDAALKAIPEALDKLPARDRALITLHDLEGVNQAALAQKFDVHQGNISRWLADARQSLREEIMSILLKNGFDAIDFGTCFFSGIFG